MKTSLNNILNYYGAKDRFTTDEEGRLFLPAWLVKHDLKDLDKAKENICTFVFRMVLEALKPPVGVDKAKLTCYAMRCNTFPISNRLYIKFHLSFISPKDLTYAETIVLTYLQLIERFGYIAGKKGHNILNSTLGADRQDSHFAVCIPIEDITIQPIFTKEELTTIKDIDNEEIRITRARYEASLES